MVLIKAKETYKLWHDSLVNIKRIDRYTIGTKVDDVFLSILENTFRASFAYDKFEKLSFMSKTIAGCDLIRFLLQITWEQKIIDTKTYGVIVLKLEEIGRMLGGWKKSTEEKTSAKK